MDGHTYIGAQLNASTRMIIVRVCVGVVTTHTSFLILECFCGKACMCVKTQIM